MSAKVKFKAPVTSMMRNGPVEGNALRIERHADVVSVQVCYSQDSTARGYVNVPADSNTLRSIAKAFTDLANDLDRAAEEPDEVVIPDDYEPDEVVMPEVYEGLGRCPSDGELDEV